MYYLRNKTYIAGAWDEDEKAIEQLYFWNRINSFSLEFDNIHDYYNSRDDSRTCSIKSNLSDRMNQCNMFILIVGAKTNEVTRGACYNCVNYRISYYGSYCSVNGSISNKSFVEFECDKAKREYDSGKIKILVLYNSSYVDRNKCPISLRNVGIHKEMKTGWNWDYNKVKTAFDMAKYY